MDIIKLSAIDIADNIKAGKLTAVDVANAYIEHIEKTEPLINAFLYFNKDEVLASAKEVQNEIDRLKNEGKSLPPLCGVPIAIKDNVSTKGITTTCASKMLENYIPPYDATVVKKLKENLMIILGKLNMDEFAMGSSNEHSAFMTTKNPWDLSRVPGGSSGGSAACVASHMSPLSLGSDTGGSIRQPSAFCGVTGLKPTYGSVSRYGLVAFASSLDQIGLISKDAKSCAMLFDIISGADNLDSTSQKSGYIKTYDKIDNFTKPTIAVVRQYQDIHISNEIKSAMEDAINRFRQLGCKISELSIPSLDYALSAYYVISSAQASSNLARYDGVRYGHRSEDAKDIDEQYKNSRSEGFGDEVKRRIMLGTYVLGSDYYDEYYNKALKVQSVIKKEFAEAFKTADIILTPTTPTTAFMFNEKKKNTDMYQSDIFTVGASLAGLPAVSFPAGFDENNLPIGIQLIGNKNCEHVILSTVHAFQNVTDYHKKAPKGVSYE